MGYEGLSLVPSPSSALSGAASGDSVISSVEGVSSSLVEEDDDSSRKEPPSAGTATVAFASRPTAALMLGTASNASSRRQAQTPEGDLMIGPVVLDSTSG